jgi:hypothetical protein
MTGHGTKFGRKKEEAVAALLVQRNLEDAARAVGISPKTLLRWMKEPEFDTAYRAARTFNSSVNAPLSHHSFAGQKTPSEANLD